MAHLLILNVKNLIFFALNPKFFNEHFVVRKIFFLSKRSSALKKAISTDIPKNLCQKIGNWQNGSSNIRKCAKIWSLGYVIFSLQEAAKSFLGNFPAFFAESLKKTRESFSFLTLFLFKLFTWANRTEVWHFCRFFAENLKLFLL